MMFLEATTPYLLHSVTQPFTPLAQKVGDSPRGWLHDQHRHADTTTHKTHAHTQSRYEDYVCCHAKQEPISCPDTGRPEGPIKLDAHTMQRVRAMQRCSDDNTSILKPLMYERTLAESLHGEMPLQKGWKVGKQHTRGPTVETSAHCSE